VAGDAVRTETVSVVIPTRDAGPRFERTLEAVRAQVVPERQVEIVLVDSGSCDGTLALGEHYGARALAIAPDAFNHGATRNLGVAHSEGTLVAFLVQDACPADADWLAALVRAVESDDRVVGAYGRQLAWPDDDPLTRFLVDQWHRVQGQRRTVQELAGPDALASLPYPERRRRTGFDNVSSIVRREAWDRQPFRPVRFAEDVDWAKRMLVAGYRLVYEPASRVYHSHCRPFLYNARRQYVDERILMDLLEADGPSIRSWSGPGRSVALASAVLAEARRDGRLSPGLTARVATFALATMLGSAARRLAHPALRSPRPPDWARRLDAWCLAGV
jgi:glycosyltransferase involved in cell wall biosynthesis